MNVDQSPRKRNRSSRCFGMIRNPFELHDPVNHGLRLNSVCKKSTGSVPRNRVFAHYATRCGTERVPPLNPASFGKLVRIIFPGIQTRRLGMRGESKYHYVDLSLEEDQQDIIDQERVHGKMIGRKYQSFGAAIRRRCVSPDASCA